jgi:hypothetical protein
MLIHNWHPHVKDFRPHALVSCHGPTSTSFWLGRRSDWPIAWNKCLCSRHTTNKLNDPTSHQFILWFIILVQADIESTHNTIYKQ